VNGEVVYVESEGLHDLRFGGGGVGRADLNDKLASRLFLGPEGAGVHNLWAPCPSAPRLLMRIAVNVDASYVFGFLDASWGAGFGTVGHHLPPLRPSTSESRALRAWKAQKLPAL
jgi:hypothetical protein